MDQDMLAFWRVQQHSRGAGWHLRSHTCKPGLSLAVSNRAALGRLRRANKALSVAQSRRVSQEQR
jgi:hypothetical protein